MLTLKSLVRIGILLLLLTQRQTFGNVTVSAIISDHMVLQKSKHARLWGKADPDETVKVSLASLSAQVVTAANGRWQVELDTSGIDQGPFDLIIEGKNKLLITDVLIGDVWLCSGQSNMEFSLGADANAHEEIPQSANPKLRHFNLANHASPKLEEDCQGAWEVATPTTVSRFSAVGYYFGKEIQKGANLPVGILLSAWGGTQIEGWTSAEGFAKLPELSAGREKRLAALVDYGKKIDDFAIAYRKWETQFSRQDQGAAATVSDLNAPDSEWKQVTFPGKVSVAGFPDTGTIWLKRKIIVPPAAVGKAVKIDLGVPHDFESIYWNGEKTGETTLESLPKMTAAHHYEIPSRLVKSGENILAVRLFNATGNSGILEKMTITFAPPSGRLSLIGPWQAKLESELPPLTEEARKAMPSFPTAPIPIQYNPSFLYNGMIHPILPFAIQGAVWYQGEGNANRAFQYQKELPNLIQDWREHWGYEFPFYFCQLPNFIAPTKNTWAELREAQSMALSVPNTGQAVLIDLGDPNNIHPRNKKEVGFRMALVALAKTYKKEIPYSGPVFESMKVEGDKIRVTLQFTESGLITKPANSTLEGFVICGENHQWVPAEAKIDGSTVLVSSPTVPNPIALRYGWADNPTCNLYNGAGFPTAPFRTDKLPGSTEAAKF